MTSRTLAKRLIALAKRTKTLANVTLSKSLAGEITAIHIMCTCSAKLQNTPQLISASLTCVGRLWRSRHNTIDAILIQWHVNELRGILKLLHVLFQMQLVPRSLGFWQYLKINLCSNFPVTPLHHGVKIQQQPVCIVNQYWTKLLKFHAPLCKRTHCWSNVHEKVL